MDAAAVLDQARDSLSVKRVFGDPIERNGVTVIPVARILGGVGGGGGSEDSPSADAPGTSAAAGGIGLGLGMAAGPVGAYVIRGEEVEWVPAIDVGRLTAVGAVIAIVGMLVLRSIVKTIIRG